MPSGKGYMRTIGKQTVEATGKDGEEQEYYENFFSQEKYVCEFPTETEENKSSSSSPSKDNATC